MHLKQFQQAANISARLAMRWYPHLIATFDEFSITEVAAQAMFIAQVGHESGGFQRVVENLNYTPKALMTSFSKHITPYQAEMLGRTNAHPANQKAIANLVYAYRYGNKAPDDGWKYRGRGLIQVTFLNNYRSCGNALGLDLVSFPDFLELDVNAMRSAGWYWHSRNCDRWAGDVVRVTQLINGGNNGLAERDARFERAWSVLA